VRHSFKHADIDKNQKELEIMFYLRRRDVFISSKAFIQILEEIYTFSV